MDRFRSTIHVCNFIDLGYHGSPFTWSRNHPTEGRIYIRLDKALANNAWKLVFPRSTVHHIPMSSSDHSMLSIRMQQPGPHRRPRSRPLFCFEAMWLQDPRCEEVVQEAWCEGLYKTEGVSIINCHASCRDRLLAWNKNEYGHVGKQIKKLEHKLQILENHPIQNNAEIHEVRTALNQWLDVENTMWHQRSRNLWITDGDRNTTFFHQKASNYKERNSILGICDSAGQWQGDDHTTETIILEYFENIFRSTGHSNTSVLIDAVQPVVTEEMNTFLTRTFTADEVHKALKQMHPKKSPGPDDQSTFMSDHLITDNVIVAFETMHYLSKKTNGKIGEMALKLDMSKAFDRVEWNYLGRIMEKMGFNDKWVNLMMQCITTVTYSGLSALLNQATSTGILRGVSACPHGLQISHLFFADDSIIFCQATPEQCSHLENLLTIYEQASGQLLNKEKTALFFSRNTPQDMQEEIKNRFGAKVIHQHETYLGLPSLVGRSKQNTFRALKEKLDNKLSGWKEKLLSQAGKEVLIKAVTQAIPTYTMSVFKLPDSLCDDMIGMICRFWWGQKNGQNKMAWLSWEKMCALKEKGGLGFRDLKAFNLALLTKQGWRLQNNPHSLVHRVLKARYFPNTDFLHAELGTRPSYAWRSILSAQPVLKAGYRWQVGDGENIGIWRDPWQPRPSTFRVLSPPAFLPDDTKDTACILGIPLSEHKSRDRIIWAYTPKGKFTVNSAYKVAISMTQGNSAAEASHGELQTRFGGRFGISTFRIR
ncbi:uncharacterized protein LOC115967167 [Quercus lobata]|uniref:uncharacterized protein LOC115967167 n=1 Tax=Quercus lobata TaxID=97700 RepID=UPI0012462664|nr:uncharacterized protein LOC115967167 [Quercus lobata]